MKAIRALYIYMVYILSLPVFILGAITMLVHVALTCKSKEEVSELIKAMGYGLKCGHKTNMLFVKHGKNHNKYMEIEL